ncbi:hypothetical protein ABZY16_31585 [Streptomyces sp. NPDC006553]|uniref:hypothetical protein n=1 Tax=unclassified Streptomyces TaxID=2593676 RepID=UPI00225B2B53|nr:hypothetical protein [Streptomyces sp. NBC_00233]MCX5225806.1 hypothetical protein [Streptomyces sp. NBC_00233]
MSASDQDTPAVKATEAPEAPEAEEADAAREDTSAEDRKAAAVDEAARDTSDAADERDEDDAADEDDALDEADEDDDATDEDEDEAVDGLTPKQARRIRVAVASVLLVAMAVVLVIRLASRTSVLVVGVYGLAMILCGIVIELSRNGRTRLGTWLLVGGLLAALALDWLVLP